MTLAELFHKRTMQTIGVIGMGYVGIPSAVLFAKSRYYGLVYGFQRNSDTSGYKIDLLNRGISPLKGEEPDLEQILKKVVDEKKFICTSDFTKLADCDAITLTIQTPFLNNINLVPDLGALTDGLMQVGKHMTKGTLVVIESTVTPGTTEGFAKDLLEKVSGLKAGVDFGLAHAPERVMVGSLINNIGYHDRIIGGIDETSTKRAVSLYKPVLTAGIPITMSATAAEVTKTAENAFRDLQIAAVNELALYCEAMGINVYDVRTGIDSLKGRGISREILYPGAGVGGHCLTKDTYHLERGVKTLGKDKFDFPKGSVPLFVGARILNDFMPVHMYNLTLHSFYLIDLPTYRAKVTILGWAFMPETDDARNTPSQIYYEKLAGSGVEVNIHDPYAKGSEKYPISDDLYSAIKDSDAVAIFTAHKQYRDLNPDEMKQVMDKNHPVIIDGRNMVDPDHFIGKGFIYKGIGRGDKNEQRIFGR